MSDDERHDGAPVSLSERRTAKLAPEQVVPLRLVLSFEEREAECKADGCRDFVLGYEAGQLAVRLDGKPATWHGTYHACNQDMLERVATAKSYVATVTRTTDPTWVFIEFSPLPPERHLSLVPEEPSEP